MAAAGAAPEFTRRYLDNAATSWPKPGPVLAAWQDAARRVGATAGRGTYREAVEADEIRGRARAQAARLLGGVDPGRVALPSGCTLALNQAIHGLVKPGDHVIATAADHNATLRPLHWLRQRGVIDLTIVPCDGRGWVDPAAVETAWRPTTRFVACAHASNVTGILQDAPAIAAVAHGRGGWLLLDAAQTLGVVPLDEACGADVVVAPAHKWLLGMAGAAILWCRVGIEPESLVQGGTGARSDSLDMPDAFGDRFEPGTPDVPALAALASAATWLGDHQPDALQAECRRLAAACADGLRCLRGVRVLAAGEGAPIVGFTVEGYDPTDIAAAAETIAGVQLRAGHHCAALIHDQLGTSRGGTVRASFGPFNTAADVDALVGAVASLVAP